MAAIETLQDITERKRAEGACQESERRFRGLFEDAHDAILVHGLQGNIQAVNRAATQLSGYSVDELLKVNVKSFVTGESLNLAREVRRKLLKNKPVTMPYEQRIIRKDGSEAICMITTNLITADGEPKGFQNIIRDVTEEKRMQENLRYYLEQITRAQEDERKRLARELHDDVSPSLLLLIQRLDTISLSTRPKLSESLKKDLGDLRNQAVDALERLRRYAQDLRPRILDDLGLVAALEWMTDDLAKDQEVDARVEITGAEQALPQETQLLLFRIAQEALNNIRKHAQASKVTVELKFEDKNLKMTVSDNGKGFEIPERIGDLASIGKLGLAGVQERAQLINGRLKLESEIGKGTLVTVEAPI
jgi:PAS domain S-box-containing protein